MVALGTDIVTVLTGGSSNIDPSQSIGGEPSSTPIIGVLNNLFEDVDETQATNGYEDYRCVYIFNNNTVDPFYSVKAFLHSLAGDETNVEIGVTTANEVQTITIDGTVTGGTFSVSYTPPTLPLSTVVVSYNSNPTTWATNLQTALNSIPTFSGITVNPSGTFVNRIFTVTFTGIPGNRSYDLLSVNISGLTGTGLTRTVAREVSGGPINSIPPLLEAGTTIPSGVEFNIPTSEDPINIGTLYALEGFPIWVKRITQVDASPQANAGFVLRINANPII